MFNIKYVILSVDFIYIAIYRYIYVHIEVKRNIQHFLRISYVMSKKYNRNIYIRTIYIVFFISLNGTIFIVWNIDHSFCKYI